MLGKVAFFLAFSRPKVRPEAERRDVVWARKRARRASLSSWKLRARSASGLEFGSRSGSWFLVFLGSSCWFWWYFAQKRIRVGPLASLAPGWWCCAFIKWDFGFFRILVFFSFFEYFLGHFSQFWLFIMQKDRFWPFYQISACSVICGFLSWTGGFLLWKKDCFWPFYQISAFSVNCGFLLWTGGFLYHF